MARLAAGGEELFQTFLLRGGQRGGVPGQEPVPAPGRHQLALERPHRLGEIVIGDRVFLAGKGRPKCLDIARHRLEDFDDVFLRRHRHFDRVEHRALGLLLDIGRAAVPELRHVSGGVVDGRRVPVAVLSFVPFRSRLVVDAVGFQLVATVAGERLGLGQARLVVQHPAETHFLFGDRVLFGNHHLRQPAEDLQLGRIRLDRRGPLAAAPSGRNRH